MQGLHTETSIRIKRNRIKLLVAFRAKATREEQDEGKNVAIFFSNPRFNDLDA